MNGIFKKFLSAFLIAAFFLSSAACAKEAEPYTAPDSAETAGTASEITRAASASTAAPSVSAAETEASEAASVSETSAEAPEVSESAPVSETETPEVLPAPTAAETTTSETIPETAAEETASETTVKETSAETSAAVRSETEKTTVKAAEKTKKTTVTTAPETTVRTKKSSGSSGTAAEPVPASGEGKRKLSNPNASGQAQKLYDYICGTYGNAILSGQQESTWMGSEQYEFDYIFGKTGKYPAIRGLDYMNDDFDGVNRRAAEWHKRGGIVTICWHCGCDFSGSWDECMKTEIRDWDAALTEGTPEYDVLVAGMDKAAEALSKLRDQGIPVLWRPFHELDGGWFWWSKGGAENFKKLWTLMYDRYTNHWELDNLIWVFGLSHEARRGGEWYPGEEYVDVAGADSYSDGANASLYRVVKRFVGDEMPICFHECGRIPTVEQLRGEEAGWVWFMTWHTEHITGHNDVNDLKAIYNDEYVITLDELPKL